MNNKPIQQMALLILFQAQQDQASELVIASSLAADSPVRCKVGNAWHDFAPPPAHIMPNLVAELGRLASLPDGPFPKEGIINVPFAGVQLSWKLRMASAESCELTPHAAGN